MYGRIEANGTVVLGDYEALENHKIRQAVLAGAQIRFVADLRDGYGSVSGAMAWAREIEERVTGALPAAKAALSALAKKYGLTTTRCCAVVAGEEAEGLSVSTPHLMEVVRVEANGHGLQADDPERRNLYVIEVAEAERLLAEEARRRANEAAHTAKVAATDQESLAAAVEEAEGLEGAERVDLVVTRHPGLVAYLREIGLAEESVQVVSHATADVVAGRHVCGVLPHSLSCLCTFFTEIPLALPAELRGVELTLEQVRQYAGDPATYVVRRV